mgnify:CR=1 FL=1
MVVDDRATRAHARLYERKRLQTVDVDDPVARELLLRSAGRLLKCRTCAARCCSLKTATESRWCFRC